MNLICKAFAFSALIFATPVLADYDYSCGNDGDPPAYRDEGHGSGRS